MDFSLGKKCYYIDLRNEYNFFFTKIINYSTYATSE